MSAARARPIEQHMAELKDANGNVEVAVGERIQAIVVSTSGGIVLSRKGVRNAFTQRELEDAFRAGLAVEGKVVQVVKGGCGCASPASARSVRSRKSTSPAHDKSSRARREGLYLPHHRIQGRRQERRRSRGVSTSRNSSAPAPRTYASRLCLARCSPDESASVLDFGAVIDLGGGIQGLLHVSEMSWSRFYQSQRDRRPR